jgi:C-terminal processing protease CtpA/Prc
MFRSILLFLALSLTSNSFGQKQTSPEYIHFVYFKTWNYLKYYHPDLASGKLDADSVFLKHLPELSTLKDLERTNEFFEKLMKDLPVPDLGLRSYKRAEGVISNIDFSWQAPVNFFGESMEQKFYGVFKNRYMGNDHYYLPEQSFNAELPHEKPYAYQKDDTIPLAYRLLGLAKIQGVVDYLYPHRYLMDQNKFEDLLMNSISREFRAEERAVHELNLLRLTACMEDSHSFRFYRQMEAKKEIFGSKGYPPFDYLVFDDGILITELIVSETCRGADIQVGDYILKIDGSPVGKEIDDLAKLLSVSNRPTLVHHLSNYRDNLIWNIQENRNVELEILRGSENLRRNLKFIGSGDPNLKVLNNYLSSQPSNRVEDESLVVLNKDIAYFRIDNVFRFIEHVEDARIDQQMDSILKLAGSKKGIIFDMRGYPDWGGFVPMYIVRYFGKNLVPYAKYYQVNKQEIGTYVWKTWQDVYYRPELKPEANTYSGKVIIIVNPATQSMSEWNTMCLQHVFPDALTIGEQTAGADGDLKTMSLPGGYTFDFTGNAIFYPDGTEAQKKGVKINIPVELTKENYSKGVDLMLQTAIGLIEK